MNMPFTLPDWMPGWVFLLLALPALLWALAFLLMPFSVFGLKSRIEALESQIDSLHEELRTMAMRSAGILPPPVAQLDPYDDVPNFGRIKKSRSAVAEPATQAPAQIPAARRATAAPLAEPVVPVRERLVPTPLPAASRAVRRTEPRLD